MRLLGLVQDLLRLIDGPLPAFMLLLRGGLYPVGLARSTYRNGPLIFSMWMRP
jgi:hypothetical protein